MDRSEQKSNLSVIFTAKRFVSVKVEKRRLLDEIWTPRWRQIQLPHCHPFQENQHGTRGISSPPSALPFRPPSINLSPLPFCNLPSSRWHYHLTDKQAMLTKQFLHRQGYLWTLLILHRSRNTSGTPSWLRVTLNKNKNFNQNKSHFSTKVNKSLNI